MKEFPRTFILLLQCYYYRFGESLHQINWRKNDVCKFRTSKLTTCMYFSSGSTYVYGR